MGVAFSAAYRHLKRRLNRFNIENRALKYIEKENVVAAPKHEKINIDRILEEKPYLKKQLEELRQKNESLDEYLKKVYLTSTTETSGVKSKRKLPVATTKSLEKMFFEPEKPTPGSCTLTNVVEMMVKFHENSNYWNAKTLADHYQMDLRTVVNLLTYYSFFKMEDLQSMNAEPEDQEKKIDFEVFTRLEKKPLRQIEGKK